MAISAYHQNNAWRQYIKIKKGRDEQTWRRAADRHRDPALSISRHAHLPVFHYYYSASLSLAFRYYLPAALHTVSQHPLRYAPRRMIDAWILLYTHRRAAVAARGDVAFAQVPHCVFSLAARRALPPFRRAHAGTLNTILFLLLACRALPPLPHSARAHARRGHGGLCSVI